MKNLQEEANKVKEHEDLMSRRLAMNKETWIKNVLRIYPEKTREEAETLYSKLRFV